MGTHEIANACILNHSVLIFGRDDAVGFVDIETGQVTFHHVVDAKVCDIGICGISCISGHENESIYAIGDISTPPRIILYAYPEECLRQLQSKPSFYSLTFHNCAISSLSAKCLRHDEFDQSWL